MRSRGFRESWRADFCNFEKRVSARWSGSTHGARWRTLCGLAAAGFRDPGSHERQFGSRRGSGSHLLGGLQHVISLGISRTEIKSIPSTESAGIGAIAHIEGASVEFAHHRK